MSSFVDLRKEFNHLISDDELHALLQFYQSGYSHLDILNAAKAVHDGNGIYAPLVSPHFTGAFTVDGAVDWGQAGGATKISHAFAPAQKWASANADLHVQYLARQGSVAGDAGAGWKLVGQDGTTMISVLQDASDGKPRIAIGSNVYTHTLGLQCGIDNRVLFETDNNNGIYMSFYPGNSSGAAPQISMGRHNPIDRMPFSFGMGSSGTEVGRFDITERFGVRDSAPAATISAIAKTDEVMFKLMQSQAAPTANFAEIYSYVGTLNASIGPAGRFFTQFGTVTAPSFSFVGRADAGMWSPASGTLGFATGSGERMEISSLGVFNLVGTQYIDSAAGNPVIRFRENGTNKWGIAEKQAGAGSLGFFDYTASAFRGIFDANGSFQFGGTMAFGGGQGVVGLANAGTVPSTNPAGGGVLYSEGGALKWRGSSGTVTVIAPA